MKFTTFVLFALAVTYTNCQFGDSPGTNTNTATDLSGGIPNCLTAFTAQTGAGNTGCQQCKAGFYHTAAPATTNFSCQPCTANCELCTDGVTCQKCMAKFFFKETPAPQCLACPANCDQCTDGGVCTKCSEATFKDASGLCLRCPTNCFTCNSTTNCTDCWYGFYKAANGICQACGTGCKRCVNPQTCTLCKSEYKLDDDECLLNGTSSGWKWWHWLLLALGILALLGLCAFLLKPRSQQAYVRRPSYQDQYRAPAPAPVYEVQQQRQPSYRSNVARPPPVHAQPPIHHHQPVLVSGVNQSRPYW